MTRFELAAAIRKSGLSPVAQAVGAGIVARWREDKQWARVTVEELAHEVGRSGRTVRTAINELAEAGLIEKVKTTRASLYRTPTKEPERSSRNLLEWKPISSHNLSRPERDKIFPELDGMTDEEFDAACRETTLAAQLSDSTGWTMQECVNAGPGWVRAQLDTVALTGNIPDRTDGINGSRFLSLAPHWQISKKDKGEESKYWEAIHGYQKDNVSGSQFPL